MHRSDVERTIEYVLAQPHQWPTSTAAAPDCKQGYTSSVALFPHYRHAASAALILVRLQVFEQPPSPADRVWPKAMQGLGVRCEQSDYFPGLQA